MTPQEIMKYGSILVQMSYGDSYFLDGIVLHHTNGKFSVTTSDISFNVDRILMFEETILVPGNWYVYLESVISNFVKIYINDDLPYDVPIPPLHLIDPTDSDKLELNMIVKNPEIRRLLATNFLIGEHPQGFLINGTRYIIVQQQRVCFTDPDTGEEFVSDGLIPEGVL